MRLPVLPLRNTLLFPDLTLPFSASRPQSVAALRAALARPDKGIILLAQKDPDSEEPGPAQLYAVGARGKIRTAASTEGRIDCIVQGIERVAIERFVQEHPFLEAEAKLKPIEPGDRDLLEALSREIIERAGRLQLATDAPPGQLARLIEQISEPLGQAYLLASILPMSLDKRQAVLEALDTNGALKLILSAVGHEEQVQQLRQRVSEQAIEALSREQREYVLRGQLKAIQEELHETRPEEAELDLLRERLSKTELPSEARAEVGRELAQLGRLPGFAPEHQVIRSHVEFVLQLPWKASTSDVMDLERARRVLDEDHFDLSEVKDRIIEQLAVLKLNPSARAPILCFVGPPGVGKTSLGQSIARALGRRFERMSLGGMRDEAELRGHRRTYVGAMPGRILQAVRRSGVNNPLLMLDEVDKLGRDFRGDPAAALMEILDPAQNFSFHDNYLDLPFDLSKVFFITTANTLDGVGPPLLDRMEVLRLAGYTEEEKVQIARRYLLPRVLGETGIAADRFSLSEAALRRVISRYTREAGLRQLERALARLARKLAVSFAKTEPKNAAVEEGDLRGLLGPERFFSEEARRELKPGTAAGLAWTEAGGEVLYIETLLLPGRSGLTMTGNLGEVLKESVQAAFSSPTSRIYRRSPRS